MDYLTENQYSEGNWKEELAILTKALGHPHRVSIIKFLSQRDQKDKCMCKDIVEVLPIAQSTVSQHLKILKESGWIIGEIDGPKVCYCLRDGIIEHYKMLISRL
ncbi:transcriptional regulator, ArsR family [Desulfofarcimen acetoxidans DSM 771]|jgi:DNA-binding transcriptional ArsR family regulator|uniref:Transcriptional regulator, ArsR family n=1 Tax=Desulfofarcimen acetoxidans (strain ATCC 49208 / DSM 771 / KCTC 5769 / VKM B-1644 / 5575) TaxID=485916 RepID=C8W0U6_DESAS|nr:metalloregulator ArsR/SmtB family transcription factor [Desulfofarcimen acetoxidans]ACV63351.1 transcriptional regulator, ArsR family [Desulfofarcimen acetoxidans DSM 771]